MKKIEIEKIRNEINHAMQSVHRYCDGTAYNNAAVRADVRANVLWKYFRRKYEYKLFLEEYLRRKNKKFYVSSTYAYRKLVNKSGLGWCKKYFADDEIWTNVDLDKIEKRIREAYVRQRNRLNRKYKQKTKLHKEYLSALTKREFLNNFVITKYTQKQVDENLIIHIYTICRLDKYDIVAFVKKEMPVEYIIVYQDKLRSGAFACSWTHTKNLENEFAIQHMTELQKRTVVRQGDIYFVQTEEVEVQDAQAYTEQHGNHFFEGVAATKNGKLLFKGIVKHPEHPELNLDNFYEVISMQRD